MVCAADAEHIALGLAAQHHLDLAHTIDAVTRHPGEGDVGMLPGVPGAGQALEQEVAEVEIERPGVDRLGRLPPAHHREQLPRHRGPLLARAPVQRRAVDVGVVLVVDAHQQLAGVRRDPDRGIHHAVLDLPNRERVR